MGINRLKREDTILALVDFQERLLPAASDSADLEEHIVKLVKGFRALSLPVLVTQQYTKGLGETIPSLRAVLGDFTPVEKTEFSAVKAPAFLEALEASGRRTVVITGIEAHVCVLQTALDLLEKGYQVFVAADCCGSRSPLDKKYGEKRMAQAGAVWGTCESVLFELCGGAREPGFKEISAIVK